MVSNPYLLYLKTMNKNFSTLRDHFGLVVSNVTLRKIPKILGLWQTSESGKQYPRNLFSVKIDNSLRYVKKNSLKRNLISCLTRFSFSFIKCTKNETNGLITMKKFKFYSYTNFIFLNLLTAKFEMYVESDY